MELIKNTGILFCAVFFLTGSGVLYTQTSAPKQLGTEIQAIEQQLSLSGISAAERHDALIRLAQLRQLSGNIAVAAAHWLDAAAADPYDEAALVSGAYCLAAIGEWEQAALTIQPLLASGKQGPAMLQARYLDACLRALVSSNASGSGGSGDVSALSALAEDSGFAALRPMIYYALWQIGTRNSNIAGANNAEVWKTRLLDEFPKSPEARAANHERNKNAPSISAVQGPLWLLFPGIVTSAPVPVNPAEPVQPAAVPSVSPGNAAFGVVLQTGLFGKEDNALRQSESLRKAGFAASISHKTVNGKEYWAVTVPAGQNENKTIAELKKAGFDSFPVK